MPTHAMQLYHGIIHGSYKFIIPYLLGYHFETRASSTCIATHTYTQWRWPMAIEHVTNTTDTDFAHDEHDWYRKLSCVATHTFPMFVLRVKVQYTIMIVIWKFSLQKYRSRWRLQKLILRKLACTISVNAVRRRFYEKSFTRKFSFFTWKFPDLRYYAV